MKSIVNVYHSMSFYVIISGFKCHVNSYIYIYIHMYICMYMYDIYWLVVSTHLKNISQLGSFPQVGMKTRNIWKHHLVRVLTHPHGPISLQQKSLTCGKLEDPASGPEGTSTHPRAQIKLQGGVPFLFSLFHLGHICCKNSCAAPATAISPGQRPDTPLGS